MGMDLRLLIGEKRGNEISCRTSLWTIRDYKFQDAFRNAVELNELGVTEFVYDYCNSAPDGHKIRKDKYGQILKYTTAGILQQVEFPADSARINEAIVAYIEELPPETIIVLAWC